ncbi:DEAD/DEAH box helicase, partial [Streptomyces sp. NPDC059762]|uniref:DEAD/DEAH box helicase n=1 Tax=Streptomyces sp. NPDC059762 TaxID=3346938 RepID=UPI00364C7EFE
MGGMVTSALEDFSPATRGWFTGAFTAPTAAQEGAWRAIGAGSDVLVVAPTGSGKTLAAFLASLDRLASSSAPAEPKKRCRVLYVSPLKALAVDVERNLRSPLTGIRQESGGGWGAARARGGVLGARGGARGQPRRGPPPPHRPSGDVDAMNHSTP